MKFGQFMSYYKNKNKNKQKKKFLKIFAKTSNWKLVPGLLVFAKNLAQPLLENEIFEVSYLH